MRHLACILGLLAAGGAAAAAAEDDAPLDPAPVGEARDDRPRRKPPPGRDERRARIRERVARLVEQLGDEDYDLREKASAALAEIGDDALPALRAARSSADLEVADRARRLVATIEKNPRHLEARGGWEPAGWDNPAVIDSETDPRGGGKIMVLGIPGGGEHEKSTVRLSLDDDARKRARAAARLAISVRHDSDKAVPVSAAFLTESGGETLYYETRARRVPAGKWQTLSFDLGAKDFKCEATDWAYSSALGGRQTIKSVMVVVDANRKFELRFTGLEFRK
jgi:hypothetical protein